MRTLRIASLFAGCGGTDVGVLGGFSFLGNLYKQHPVKLVYANDLDAGACDLFDDNFSIKIDRRDVRTVDTSTVADYDILTAGFPCQSFSIVAQNPPRLGIKDSDKGTLFEEVCRFLKAHQPAGFICENVKGILSANNSKAFPVIMQSLRDCGYHAIHFVLNASHYGIPQRRERVFIIGFKDRRVLEAFRHPTPIVEFPTLRDVVFPEGEIASKYYFSDKAVQGMRAAKKEMNKGRVQDLSLPCGTVGAHLAKVSLNSTDPVLCIDGKYRRFTPREVARIQSFPDSYRLTGAEARQYKALGNAIPPVLAWHVMKSVVEAMQRVQTNVVEADETKPDIQDNELYESHFQRQPVQLTLFDPIGLFVVSKHPVILLGTYRKICRDWIVGNNLYNYPVTSQEIEKHEELRAVSRLILKRQKDEPLYFSVNGYSIVTKADLLKHEYKPSKNHPPDTKYFLYKLERLNEPIPTIYQDEMYIVGKGVVKQRNYPLSSSQKSR